MGTTRGWFYSDTTTRRNSSSATDSGAAISESPRPADQQDTDCGDSPRKSQSICKSSPDDNGDEDEDGLWERSGDFGL